MELNLHSLLMAWYYKDSCTFTSYVQYNPKTGLNILAKFICDLFLSRLV